MNDEDLTQIATEAYERCAELILIVGPERLLKASYYGDADYPKVCLAMAGIANDSTTENAWRELSLIPHFVPLRVCRVHLDIDA
jgi:hypothetical protein